VYGIVFSSPKNENSIAHPHVIPNPSDFCSCSNYKNDFF